ncbi:MAG: ATP-dependent helicase, partial [Candidatus Binatia bacterium]
VPTVPDDYIHRVGRTARAEATGDAFTFVSPQEQGDLAQIERALGKRLPRVTVPDFDYNARPAARLEVPLAERIAAIRSRKTDERARGRANAERRAARPATGPARSTPQPEPKPGASETPSRSHHYGGRRSGRRGRRR